MLKAEPSSSRFLYGCIIFLVFAVAAVLRVSNYQEVLANFFGHLNFYDPDSYYQLRRLAYFVQNFPDYQIFDPLLNWPKGSWVPWSEGFLFLFGLPLKLFGVNNFHSLEMGASMISVIWGLLTILVSFLFGKLFLRPRAEGLLLLMMLAINGCLIRYSCLGQVDHHIVEAFLVPSILGLAILGFEGRSILASMILGLLSTGAIFVSSFSIFPIGGLFIMILIFWREPHYRRCFLSFGVSFLISLWFLVFLKVRQNGMPYSLQFPSYFQLGLMTLCVGAVYLFLHGRRWRWSSLAIGLCVLVVCFLFPGLHPFLGRLHSAFSYVGGAGILGSVLEAQPAFLRFGELDTDFMQNNFSYLVYALPGLLAFSIWRASKGLADRRELMLLCLFLVFLVPGLMQKRFIHLMMPGYLVFTTFYLFRFLDWLKPRSYKLVPFFWALFVAGLILPGFRYDFTPRFSSVHRVDFSLTKIFFENIEVKNEEVWQRLGQREFKDAEGFSASPNLGNLILYTTGLAPMVNSFYYKDGLRRDFELRTEEDPSIFKQKLEDWKLKYLVVTNDVQYLDLLHTVFGNDSSYLVSKKENGDEVFNLGILDRFIWFQLLKSGSTYPWLIDRFGFQIREPHFYNRLKVFEFKPESNIPRE